MIAVELRATAGPRYTLPVGRAARASKPPASGRRKLREAFAVKAGDPVVAEKVIAAGVALKVALGEEGFALADVGEQDIVLDHETATARLVLPVTPGPVARFGDIRVTGQPPFSSRHVGRIARFKKGDQFERSEVDDLRRALIATGLVASVETKLVPVDERPGGRYRRASGAGADADHRRRAWLWHRRGRAARGELAAPQFLQSRRRADRCAGWRGRRSSWRRCRCGGTISGAATRC